MIKFTVDSRYHSRRKRRLRVHGLSVFVVSRRNIEGTENTCHGHPELAFSHEPPRANTTSVSESYGDVVEHRAAFPNAEESLGIESSRICISDWIV